MLCIVATVFDYDNLYVQRMSTCSSRVSVIVNILITIDIDIFLCCIFLRFLCFLVLNVKQVLKYMSAAKVLMA